MRFLFYTILFLFVAFFSSNAQSLDEKRQEVYDAINIVRKAQMGIKRPVKVIPELEEEAQRKAEALLNDSFDDKLINHHSTRKELGKNGELLYFCKEYDGHRYSVWGWLRSPSHRKALLTKKYNKVGIGIAESEDEGTYTVLWLR